jgi:hypothetical protein
MEPAARASGVIAIIGRTPDSVLKASACCGRSPARAMGFQDGFQMELQPAVIPVQGGIQTLGRGLVDARLREHHRPA